jgi:hypothetical protein
MIIRQEDRLEKGKTGEKAKSKAEEDMETSEEEGNKTSASGEFTPTYKMSRGTGGRSWGGRSFSASSGRSRRWIPPCLSKPYSCQTAAPHSCQS